MLSQRGQCHRQVGLVKRRHDPRGLLPAGRRDRRWGHLHEHLAGQSGVGEQFEGLPPAGPREHGPQFGRHPLRAHRGHEVRHPFDGRAGVVLQHEAEKGGESHRPQHPQVVFAKPHRRHADRPDNPVSQIGPAPHEVVHLAGRRVEEQAVDREIPPLGILPRRAKRHAGRVAAVGVWSVGPKRGHLHLACIFRPQNGDHAERRPDGERPAAAEKSPHVVGSGGRGHVVVGRNSAEELVPHAPSGPIRLVPRPPEPVDDLSGKLSRQRGIAGDGGHGNQIVNGIRQRSI